jgi:hypothetical protein
MSVMAKKNEIPPEIQERLGRLEMVRRQALSEDPPDFDMVIASLKERVRLLHENGAFDLDLTPEQEARLIEEMESLNAEADLLERRFYGQRES